MTLIKNMHKILIFLFLSLFSGHALSAECTNLHDVLDPAINSVTINGVTITAAEEGRGNGAHSLSSGNKGTNTDIYTSLSNTPFFNNGVSGNTTELENYIYHRITFSEAISVGDIFTLSDIDGKKDHKELVTVIGASNGNYVEPSFTQIGSTLSQIDFDISDLPSGLNGVLLSQVPVYESDDKDQTVGGADGAIVPDFGSDLVTDLYFIFAINEEDDSPRGYWIEGCLEDAPGLSTPILNDYGDADASYGDATHRIVDTPITYLGTIPPDADTVTQNDASGASNGIGDDSDGNDDEDAHNILPILYTTDATYEIITPCTGSSTVAAWFDIDTSGVFDADERVEDTCNGTNATLSWQGLASIAPGITALRLRTASNSAELATPTGAAQDGEVEDYRVQIKKPNNECASPVEFTWNGAPNGAGTQTNWTNLANDLTVDMESAASGIIYTVAGSLDDPGNSLDLVKTKTDGVYGTGYLTMYKSDENGAQNDVGDKGSFTFSFDKPVYLSNWRVDDIDVGASTFQDIVEMTALDANGNDVPLTMLNVGSDINQQGQDAIAIPGTGGSSPSDPKAQASWTSNFAINTLKLSYISGPDIPSPTVQAIRVPGFSYCEVGFDFGDAPSSYSGASHFYTDLPVIWLGNEPPDEDTNLQAGTDAMADDLDFNDDEDGVSTFPELADSDNTYSVDVVVTNVSGETAYVVGWIDFNGNMQFDPDEAVSEPVLNGASGQIITLNWANLPNDTQAGETYARFRLTTDSAVATGFAATSSASGVAINGEVEDYPLTIKIGGFPVSGRIYEDTNVDGVNDPTEAGISDVTVVLMKIEPDPANNSCVSTKTDADGNYIFPLVLSGDYQLYEASGETAPEPQNCSTGMAADPSNYHSTTMNTTTPFSVVDQAVTNNDFGDVRLPLFEPDNTGQILPGSVAFYAHRITAPANGNITFSNEVSQQVTSGWTNIIYQDLNCDGVLNESDETSPINTSPPQTVIAATENNPVCIINKVFTPVNALNNEQQLQTITAVFDYDNAIAGIVELVVTDLSITSRSNSPDTSTESSALELIKTVQNITQGTAATRTVNHAIPGDKLKYVIYYKNKGSGPITNLQLHDSVPSYTKFLANSALCVLTPSNMNCIPNISGEGLVWDFTGTLAGGANGHVCYIVEIDQ